VDAGGVWGCDSGWGAWKDNQHLSPSGFVEEDRKDHQKTL
jgi:hypothetical protein